MNLAEYQREMHAAHGEYREILERAGEQLQKRLMVAQQEFLGEDVQGEPGEPVKWQRRDG